ncbi:Transcriptional regulator TetR family [Patulibacter medicamentivorans]|uniref:Transcriptional regulator TetR family n=1 Tax=Patulibacter medicamentivorans TaxID=1097667 RepID=H0EA46_9ACTN|nr:TetR/AcrR family transcriptional regulator [Patulibacter medicamentivorans]EHN09386.1 Transcriptional regulator TetR family [Patulibacter medicamentivorans]
MPTPPPDQPPIARLRREPQQERSRERLQRALDAADRLLASEGLEALTTTRIAREAGISVGSLYQYVPDREAIIDALATRYLAEFDGLVEELVAVALSEHWDDPTANVVWAFASRWRAQPGYRALWLGSHLTPELEKADRQNKRIIAEAARRVLVAQGHATDSEALARKCWIGVLACDALLREAFRIDPDGDPATLEETIAMLRAYIATAPAADADQTPAFDVRPATHATG